MGAQGEQRGRWMQIDFVGRRKLWFAMSGVVILIGVVSLGIRGLNLGIDFEGGTQVSFTTSKPVPLETVRSEAAKIGQGGAEILGRGPETGSGNFREFELRTEALPAADASRLQRDLTSSVQAQNFGTTTVSASFGSQIAKSAIYAVIFSLLLIVAYISMRFHWKFAVPVIVALIHDILITIGVYSVTGRLMTSATVAAILTVLGYSIYDTIIIFDRIRENVPLMRRATFQSIADLSLWEVMRRSLATTLCTLLPVMALFFFGGETLKDFAFALIVGTASGTYSSVFIAGPLLTHWKERDAVYARRRARIVEELGRVPAYATTAAGAPADVAPAERPKRGRRLTTPDDPERRVAPDEFDEMVRDLHTDAPPARTATVERSPEREPATDGDGEGNGGRDSGRDLDPEDLVMKEPRDKKPKRPRNRRHGRSR
jgi:SecD/SecF fusion protein